MKWRGKLTKIKLTKEQRHRRYMRIGAYVCFGVAVALMFITYALTVPAVQKSLANIDLWFQRLELFIAQYESLAALYLLLFLFLIKGFVPIIPFSVLFISSGMVFDEWLAFMINITGFIILCIPKFIVGRKKGGGGVKKFMHRSKRVYKFMEFDGSGNKWMLALMRFTPFFPVNTVSKVYGATQMKTETYILYSVLGFLPRLVLWSVISFNIFDPFTVEFMAPIIILLIISGISLLLLNVLLRKETEK